MSQSIHHVKQFSHLPLFAPENQGTTGNHKQFITVRTWTKIHRVSPSEFATSRGLFWSASDILYNVDQICDLADEYIARAVRRQVGPEELDLLQRALKHTYGLSSLYLHSTNPVA